MYTTIINNNPDHEFDSTDVPPCMLHCMFSVVVNHKSKELDNFIHFGIECTEYNSVTSTSNSIIDNIADNIESASTQILKVVEPMISLVNHSAATILGPSKNPTTITNPDVQTDLSYKKN
ncbi:21621_t:CDS:2 [Cetraspora pellucida]|uniref:21621_t:CDS:1 n=1 Tax=Cetraspora pellucida TaxID=1433469 RepID=A0A9N9HJV6_9GLOM|nr:21621_t:CDS:2 [Cetraspora pellucida]